MNLLLIRILQAIAAIFGVWTGYNVLAVQQQTQLTGSMPDISSWIATVLPAIGGIGSYLGSWFLKIKSGAGTDVAKSLIEYLADRGNKDKARRFWLSVISLGQEVFEGNEKLEEWLANGGRLLVDHFFGLTAKTTQKAAK